MRRPSKLKMSLTGVLILAIAAPSSVGAHPYESIGIEVEDGGYSWFGQGDSGCRDTKYDDVILADNSAPISLRGDEIKEKKTGTWQRCDLETHMGPFGFDDPLLKPASDGGKWETFFNGFLALYEHNDTYLNIDDVTKDITAEGRSSSIRKILNWNSVGPLKTDITAVQLDPIRELALFVPSLRTEGGDDTVKTQPRKQSISPQLNFSLDIRKVYPFLTKVVNNTRYPYLRNDTKLFIDWVDKWYGVTAAVRPPKAEWTATQKAVRDDPVVKGFLYLASIYLAGDVTRWRDQKAKQAVMDNKTEEAELTVEKYQHHLMLREMDVRRPGTGPNGPKTNFDGLYYYYRMARSTVASSTTILNSTPMERVTALHQLLKDVLGYVAVRTGGEYAKVEGGLFTAEIQKTLFNDSIALTDAWVDYMATTEAMVGTDKWRNRFEYNNKAFFKDEQYLSEINKRGRGESVIKPLHSNKNRYIFLEERGLANDTSKEGREMVDKNTIAAAIAASQEVGTVGEESVDEKGRGHRKQAEIAVEALKPGIAWLRALHDELRDTIPSDNGPPDAYREFAWEPAAPGIKSITQIPKAVPGKATLVIQAPTETGGLPIESYRVRVTKLGKGGGRATEFNTTNTNVELEDLELPVGKDKFRPYRVSVFAINAMGESTEHRSEFQIRNMK